MRNQYTGQTKKKYGSAMIEYGLIAAGIGVAITTVIDHVGAELKTLFMTAGMGLQ